MSAPKDTRAAGLLAAARHLRSELAWLKYHADDPRPPAPPYWRNTCYERSYVLGEAIRWCEAQARAARRGK